MIIRWNSINIRDTTGRTRDRLQAGMWYDGGGEKGGGEGGDGKSWIDGGTNLSVACPLPPAPPLLPSPSPPPCSPPPLTPPSPPPPARPYVVSSEAGQLEDALTWLSGRCVLLHAPLLARAAPRRAMLCLCLRTSICSLIACYSSLHALQPLCQGHPSERHRRRGHAHRQPDRL